jgi:hypothetical protein
MAKEPAGLRRWRLAHRKHKKHRKVYVVARRRRSYRGRKGHGRRGSKAFPIMGALPVIVPLLDAYKSQGFTKGFPENYLYQQTGYALSDGTIHWGQTTKIAGLAILGIVGHKVAGRVGLNKYVKKLSLGWFQL